MTDLIERLRKMPCGSPECDGGAIPHGPTPDGHWEAEQCQICAYIKEAADRLERLEFENETLTAECTLLRKAVGYAADELPHDKYLNSLDQEALDKEGT